MTFDGNNLSVYGLAVASMISGAERATRQTKGKWLGLKEFKHETNGLWSGSSHSVCPFVEVSEPATDQASTEWLCSHPGSSLRFVEMVSNHWTTRQASLVVSVDRICAPPAREKVWRYMQWTPGIVGV